MGPLASRIVDAGSAAAREDARIVGLTIGGSVASGTVDEFSDLDLVIVCRDEAHREILAGAREFAARLGPVLAAFTGEHVGEPRLLICLYGPPPFHVDLKFVGLADLSARVEDGLVIWERDGEISAALTDTAAEWPQPDAQWIEDRFWVWIHYGATKLGRGELFECLDMLAYLRSEVFGPLLATIHGHPRSQRVRRVEEYAPTAVPALEATIGDQPRAPHSQLSLARHQ